MTDFEPGDRVITPNRTLGTVESMEPDRPGEPRRVIVDGVSWPASAVKPLVSGWENE